MMFDSHNRLQQPLGVDHPLRNLLRIYRKGSTAGLPRFRQSFHTQTLVAACVGGRRRSRAAVRTRCVQRWLWNSGINHCYKKKFMGEPLGSHSFVSTPSASDNHIECAESLVCFQWDVDTTAISGCNCLLTPLAAVNDCVKLVRSIRPARVVFIAMVIRLTS
jgi:hypothetical protein